MLSEYKEAINAVSSFTASAQKKPAAITAAGNNHKNSL